MKTKLLVTIAFALQSIFALAQMSVNVSATNNIPCDTCLTLSADVIGGVAPYTYQWYTNSQLYDTIQTINYCNMYPATFSGDTVKLIVADVNSQQATYSNGVTNLLSSSLSSTVPNGYKLCVVTVDSATGKNLVVWEQTTDPSIVSYNIFKQNTSSDFVEIAEVPRTSFSTFVDTLSNPAQVSAMYNISVTDSCGFESSLDGTPINTIHLAIGAGIPPAWNLDWNWTQGYPISKYRIWRATTPNNLVLIDSVANSIYAYTDLTPPTGVLYYTIEARSTASCNPSFKTSQVNSTYSSSFSNVVDNGVVGIGELNIHMEMNIFPNPFSVQTVLRTDNFFSDATLVVDNCFGQTVKQIKHISGRTVSLSRDNLSNGLYFLRLTDVNKIYTGKLVITD